MSPKRRKILGQSRSHTLKPSIGMLDGLPLYHPALSPELRTISSSTRCAIPRCGCGATRLRLLLSLGMDGTRTIAQEGKCGQDVRVSQAVAFVVLTSCQSKHIPCTIVQGRYDIVCPVRPRPCWIFAHRYSADPHLRSIYSSRPPGTCTNSGRNPSSRSYPTRDTLRARSRRWSCWSRLRMSTKGSPGISGVPIPDCVNRSECCLGR